jgi:hypothetical protein
VKIDQAAIKALVRENGLTHQTAVEARAAEIRAA